jgi:serine-type D-Ala-D-Ala carboxypeptidase (penicillin-binding protein 5/6)
MTQRSNKLITITLSMTLGLSLLCNAPLLAQSTPTANNGNSAKPAIPAIIPPKPDINAHGFVLMDAKSGNILAEKNMGMRMQPASLTKMMTLYITFDALKSGRLKLDNKVRVSKKAWGTGGSRMFLKENSKVSVEHLIQGVIVDSGNDACTTLAETIGGNEKTFAQIMNQTAKQLGMDHTHYVDSTGLPRKNHYSTPHDMSLLARALVNNFPEYYHFFKQKWFTYNKIRQPNRNRLLWRGAQFDGLKTGHTKEAGYCLVASGIENGTRLISVVMGAPTDLARANDSQALLNYGFRFFETHKLFSANQALSTPRIWLGQSKYVKMGLNKNLYITIPAGQYKHLKASLSVRPKLIAPIEKGQSYGNVTITLNNKVMMTRPLIAFSSDQKGNLWTRTTDHIALFFKSWFKS